MQEPARQAAWQLHAQLGDRAISVDLADDEQAARAAFAEARRKLGTTSAAKYVALTPELIVERSTLQYIQLTAHGLR